MSGMPLCHVQCIHGFIKMSQKQRFVRHQLRCPRRQSHESLLRSQASVSSQCHLVPLNMDIIWQNYRLLLAMHVTYPDHQFEGPPRCNMIPLDATLNEILRFDINNTSDPSFRALRPPHPPACLGGRPPAPRFNGEEQVS